MPNDDFRNTLALIKDIFDSYNNSVVSVTTKKDDYIQVFKSDSIIMRINSLITCYFKDSRLRHRTDASNVFASRYKSIRNRYGRLYDKLHLFHAFDAFLIRIYRHEIGEIRRSGN